MFRKLLSIAAVFCVALLAMIHLAHAGVATPSADCGTPLASGQLTEPPRVDMATQPVDDRGDRELILRVRRAGDRFCYRYALAGIEEHRAPTIVVRPGERFAVRIVNELMGPARGATMAASALAPCTPQRMMPSPVRTYTGYMNHTIFARAMPAMTDDDVNLHLHGFEGSPAEDNVFLSTLDSPDRACEYVFTVPQMQPPGTYFYHPHIHGMADDEVGGGLAGTWIVLPAKPVIPVTDDHLVTLRYRIPYEDDQHTPHVIALFRAAAAHAAALPAATPVPFDPFSPPPWPSSIPISAGKTRLHDLCGYRANVKRAVNDVDAPAVLTVPANEPQLIRLVDAESDGDELLRARDASGAVQPLRVVEKDGVPVGDNKAQPLSRYVESTAYSLPAAGRVALLMTLVPGQRITISSDATCTAPLGLRALATPLLVVRAGPPAPTPSKLTSRPLVDARNPAVALITYARAHPTLVRRRAFTYSQYVLPGAHGSLDGEYFLTETSKPGFHETPFFPVYRNGARDPMPTVVVHRGSLEEWYLFNATMEVHSFHIHQMAFVNESSVVPSTLDTAIVPFGSLLPNAASPAYPLIKPSVTRVLLDFRNVPRGTFVFHCHELYHEDRGMMGVIRVV